MTQLHHGITAREAAIGKLPLRNADTNTIAMLAFADDADEVVFPLNTPILVTSINRVLSKAGTQGNLRKNLEIISSITSPTLVVIRIEDPFNSEEFKQSLVIGTTDKSGNRTGLQALLTVKSVLGITPKIICVSDAETIDVANALGAICKKLRAYAYITPRNENGAILPTAEAVTAFRKQLALREIEIIWPEWTSDNVFSGVEKPINAISVGISPDLQYDGNEENRLQWAIEVNGTLYPTEINGDSGPYLEDYLQDNEETLGITGEYESNDGGSSAVFIRNITNTRKFIRLIPDGLYKNSMTLIGNPTATIDSDGVISFWLEANSEVIKPEPEVCNCENDWIIIPTITPATVINDGDSIYISVDGVAQITTTAMSNNQSIIDFVTSTLNNRFPDHLELIRCDGEGTLLRNKTDACLKLSIFGQVKNADGEKELANYLPKTDLCAFDSSAVLPEPNGGDNDIRPMIVRGGARGGSAELYSVSKLKIKAPANVNVGYQDYSAAMGVHYYSFQSSDGTEMTIEILPDTAGSQLSAISLSNLPAILQWYSEGYERFDDPKGQFAGFKDATSVPNTAPPKTTNYDYMFAANSNVLSELEQWDVRLATSMNNMLYVTQTLNLSRWCVSNITTEPAGWNELSLLTPPVWGTCPND
jgi:hypothetical protein